MYILARYKNSQGKIYKYLCVDRATSVQKFFTPEEMLQNYKAGLVENAVFTPNQGFRAKAGSHINTVSETKNLLVSRQQSKPDKTKGSMPEIDYFGNGCIKACRKIRECALSRNIVVQETPHMANNGCNVQLFKLIEACGISVEDFVTGYLSVLQPYSLMPWQSRKKSPSKDSIWVLELGYGADLLIKLDNVNSDSPVVVSFHESNVGGILRTTPVDFSSKPCAVFVSSLTGKNVNTEQFHVQFTIQKGFIRLRVSDSVSYYKDGVALVNYHVIQNEVRYVFRNRLRDLSEFYYAGDTFEVQNNINNLVVLDRLSFISHGYATVNNICLLLDLYSQFANDVMVRSLITTITCELVSEIPLETRKELKIALASRYKVQNKLFQVLVETLDSDA